MQTIESNILLSIVWMPR